MKVKELMTLRYETNIRCNDLCERGNIDRTALVLVLSKSIYLGTRKMVIYA